MDVMGTLMIVLQYLWIIIFAMGIGVWVLVNQMMRRIYTMVEYHRKGTTVESYRCIEINNNIEFYTKGTGMMKKGEKVLVSIVAKPETLVRGLRTYRLHHAVEGCKMTVDPRDAGREPAGTGKGYGTATSLTVMGEAYSQMGKGYPEGKGTIILTIIIGIMCFLIGLLLGVSPIIKK